MSLTSNDFIKGTLSSNGVAILTLDRPKSLNAVNLEMHLQIRHFLDEWETDQKVKCVLVVSSSPRAFSAGGDVKRITIKHEKSDMIEVFTAEYSLICKISEYRKPYISLMDGITMGFGIALSGHGHYRVITEKTVLSMPENAIGLYPDVGFSYIAARSPGEGAVGAYLGMTGDKISSPADALYSGVGTHYVPSRDIDPLKQALTSHIFSSDPHKDIKEVLRGFGKEPESEASLKLLFPHILSTFGSYNKPILEMIEDLKLLQKSPDIAVAKWAKGALVGLEKGAPFSLCLTREYFKRVASACGEAGNDLSKITGVMKLEYRISMRASLRNDFVEGVRAVLIDKDQKPRWNPSRLEDVDWKEIYSLFEPFDNPDEELRV
ncbi:3-hydroxyisobutyryl-CoA hydrolase [Ranunculus cassubicifolius]